MTTTRPHVERDRVGGIRSRWILPADATVCPGSTGICGKGFTPENEEGITQWVCASGHRWWPPGYDPLDQPVSGTEPTHKGKRL